MRPDEGSAYGRSGSVPPVDLMECPDEPDENTRPLKRPSSVPLLCGLRLLFEGRVVGVLEFSEWDAAVARVKPTIAVPVDPASGGVFDIRDGLVRSVVEAGGTGSFDLVEPVDHLYERELKLSFH